MRHLLNLGLFCLVLFFFQLVQAQNRNSESAIQIFRQAYRTMLDVRDAYKDQDFRQKIIQTGRSPEQYAWQQYRSGLEQLKFLTGEQNNYSNILIQFPLSGKLPPPGGVPWDRDITLTLKRAIELVGMDYAPWGIEFTYFLLRTFDNGQALFDLRILRPVGDLLFVDVSVPAEMIPDSVKNNPEYKSEISQFTPKKLSQVFTLRLFADRTVNREWTDWLLQRTDDTALRWGPVLYGGATYMLLGTGSLLTLGIEAAWSVTEATLDFYQDMTDAEAHYVTQTQWVTTGIGDGAEPALKAMVHMTDGQVVVNNQVYRVTQSDLRWGVGRLMISASVAYGLQKINDGFLKEIGRIPTGRNGYYNGYVPPVLLIGYLEGEKVKKRGDEYTVIQAQSVGWNLNFQGLYPGDLSETIGNPLNFEFSFARLPFDSYRKGRAWPLKIIQDPSPDAQFIRFAIPRTVIEKQIQMLNLGTTWDKVDLLTLGYLVRVTTADSFFDFELQDVTQPNEIQKGVRYAAVRFHRKGQMAVPPEVTGCPREYAVDSKMIDQTRAQYQIQLLNTKFNDRSLSSVPKKIQLNIQSPNVKKRMGQFPGPLGGQIQQSWFLHDAGPLGFVDVVRPPQEMSLSFKIKSQYSVKGSESSDGLYDEVFENRVSTVLRPVNPWEFAGEENEYGATRKYRVVLSRDYLTVLSLSVHSQYNSSEKSFDNYYEIKDMPLRLLSDMGKNAPIFSAYFYKNKDVSYTQCRGESTVIETYWDAVAREKKTRTIKVKTNKCYPDGSRFILNAISMTEKEMMDRLQRGEIDRGELERSYGQIQDEIYKWTEEDVN